MNVIRRAKAVVAAEVSNTQAARAHAQQSHSAKPKLVDGELHWIAEHYDPKETKPVKLKNGDKQELTPAEIKHFARTPYERGFLDYEYEGTMRLRANPDVSPGVLAAQSRPQAGANNEDGVSEPGVPEGDPRYWTREGTGILKYPTGQTFEGQWRTGRRHGEGGFVDPTGYRFRGLLKDDTIEGPGCEEFRSKAKFQGDYLDGLPHGKGVMLFTAASQYRYEGEFMRGRRHGKGITFYQNGDTFQGTWVDGKRHGKGITTTYNELGREIQYETEWQEDILCGGPFVLEKGRRTQRPKAVAKVNRTTMVPADLTKWKVKDGLTELSLEHFLRIKLGFEQLDVNGTGSLSTEELTQIWGADSRGMLLKLDTDGNGTVELDEIFGGWYPDVPAHNISRFMQLDINPKTLLRIRGFLAGVKDEQDSGFMQMVGIKSADDEGLDKPITQKILDTWGWKIGGERFTLSNFEAAKALCDPPHFMEILEVWYPNMKRSTLMRYEMADIPQIERIKTDFLKLSGGSFEVSLESFEEAQEEYCKRNYGEEAEARKQKEREEEEAAKKKAAEEEEKKKKEAAAAAAAATAGGGDASSPPSSPVPAAASPLSKQPAAAPLSQEELILSLAEEGFFKGQPFWPLGGDAIQLSVALLKEIDKFDRRVEGIISLQQILRYCYPNIRCKRTQDQLSGRRKGGACNCKICMLA